MPTVGELVRKTTEFFTAKSTTARLDSELLIGKALGLDRLQVFLKYDLSLNEEQVEKCRALVRRRAKGEPVAYILGEKSFFKHSFEVNTHTLIPRPETEMLVVRGLEILEPLLSARGPREKSAVQLEIAAAFQKRSEAERGIQIEEPSKNMSEAEASPSPSVRSKITIADLGCGTGCIGLSIADEIKNRADVRLIFVDISADALEVAQRNAKRLDLDSISEFIVGDVGSDDLLQRFAMGVDLVVANPPYIDPADSRIEAGVRDFEPHQALFAGGVGELGLKEIRRWSKIAKQLSETALFEIGDSQGSAAIEIFHAAGWEKVKLSLDLSSRERMIEATVMNNTGDVHG